MLRDFLWPSRSRAPFLLGLALLATVNSAAPAAGETVANVLSAAHDHHPGLNAERARRNAAQEGVAISEARRRPSVSLSGQYGHTNEHRAARTTSSDGYQSGSYSISGRQLLFDGGETRNAVSEAHENALAGSERLRAVEADVLLAAATAYSDVVRDRAKRSYRAAFVRLLHRAMEDVRRRVELRESTRTDLDQARSRLAGAQAALAGAEADLQSSVARFERIVGRAPGKLTPASAHPPGLPHSLPAALEMMREANPRIVEARHRESASQWAVSRVHAERAPKVALEMGFSQSVNPDAFTDRSRDGRMLVRLDMPLYRGGDFDARLRQAKHEQVSAHYETADLTAAAEAEVRSAWSSLSGAREQKRFAVIQRQAAAQALSGVIEEFEVGQRNFIEVLNARQELVEAQIAEQSALRDEIVAAYSVLAVIGRLHLDWPAEGDTRIEGVTTAAWLGAWTTIVEIVAPFEPPSKLGALVPADVPKAAVERPARGAAPSSDCATGQRLSCFSPLAFGVYSGH